MVLFAGASYGFIAPLVKLANQAGIAPDVVILGQYVAPLLVMWALTLPAMRGLNPSPALLFDVTALGLASGLTSLFYYLALSRLSAALAVILLFQFSWMVVAMDWAGRGKKPGVRTVFAILAIFVGTLLASGIDPAALPKLDWAGVGFGFLSAGAYAAMIYFSGSPRLADWPTTYRATASTTVAFFLLFLLYAVIRPHPAPIPRSLGQWEWVSGIGVFSQALPIWLLSRGAPRLGGTLAGILASVELPVAIGFSAWLLGEAVGFLELVGIALILAGIVAAEISGASSVE